MDCVGMTPTKSQIKVCVDIENGKKTASISVTYLHGSIDKQITFGSEFDTKDLCEALPEGITLENSLKIFKTRCAARAIIFANDGNFTDLVKLYPDCKGEILGTELGIE